MMMMTEMGGWSDVFWMMIMTMIMMMIMTMMRMMRRAEKGGWSVVSWNISGRLYCHTTPFAIFADDDDDDE